MVKVPDRGLPEFAVTVYETTPLPVPPGPEVMERNPAFDVAVHEHPACVVTFTVPDPPAALYDMPVGKMVQPQNTPNTPTPFVVPTYTLPFTTVGTINLFPAPKWSRLFAAMLVLYSSVARLPAS